MNFDGFVKEIEENKWPVFGVEVYENGALTHSYGDTENSIQNAYSATKSIVSIAFGIAYDRGLICLNKSVLDYLPEDKLAKLTQKQKDTFSKITMSRHLTMSVGDLPFRPEGDNFLDYSFKCEIKNPDEKVFNYSNINTFLVSVALTKALGCDLGKFIEKEIFEPLDITDYKLGYSPEGYYYGATNTEISVHDLSKFGILMSNKGIYNGKRIISEEYINLATSVQQMNREGGYGFFFWKFHEGFSINGKWGQKCYCLPDRGLIVSFMAHLEEGTDALYESAERNMFEK